MGDFVSHRVSACDEVQIYTVLRSLVGNAKNKRGFLWRLRKLIC